MAAGKRSRLPTEYQEVEHLINTGQSRINTGVVAATDVAFSTSFYYTGGGTYPRPFGAQNNKSGTIRMQCVMSSTTYSAQSGRVGANIFLLNISESPLNSWHYFYISNRYLMVDDNEATSDNTNESPNKNICIFDSQDFAGSSTYAYGRVKQFDVTKGGVLVRILVPCYRKSDNKPGMYDLCGSICPLTNSPFYINAGTDEFLVGPDVN